MTAREPATRPYLTVTSSMLLDILFVAMDEEKFIFAGDEWAITFSRVIQELVIRADGSDQDLVPLRQALARSTELHRQALTALSGPAGDAVADQIDKHLDDLFGDAVLARMLGFEQIDKDPPA